MVCQRIRITAWKVNYIYEWSKKYSHFTFEPLLPLLCPINKYFSAAKRYIREIQNLNDHIVGLHCCPCVGPPTNAPNGQTKKCIVPATGLLRSSCHLIFSDNKANNANKEPKAKPHKEPPSTTNWLRKGVKGHASPGSSPATPCSLLLAPWWSKDVIWCRMIYDSRIWPHGHLNALSSTMKVQVLLFFFGWRNGKENKYVLCVQP